MTIVTTLKEPRLLEQWRTFYNTERPHSALDYRPPAPVTIVPSSNANRTLRKCNDPYFSPMQLA